MKWLPNLIYFVVGPIAGVITLFVFVTGWSSLPALFSRSAPSPVTTSSSSAITPEVSPHVPSPGSSADGVQRDPITFEAFLREALNPDLTEIQRSEFVRAHSGRRVMWKGYVGTVSEAQLPKSQKYFLALMAEAPSAEQGPFHWIYTIALFDDQPRQDLLALRQGQKVEVSGFLKADTDVHSLHILGARLERVYPVDP